MMREPIFWFVAVIVILTTVILVWGFERDDRFFKECVRLGGIPQFLSRGGRICHAPGAIIKVPMQ